MILTSALPRSRIHYQGMAFFLFRKEKPNVRYEACEISTAKTTQQGKNQEQEIQCTCVLHCIANAQGRD